MDLLDQKGYSYYKSQIKFYEEALRNSIIEHLESEEFIQEFKNSYLSPSLVLDTLHFKILFDKYKDSDKVILGEAGYSENNMYIENDADDICKEYGAKYYDLINIFYENRDANLCFFEHFEYYVASKIHGETISFILTDEEMEYLDDYCCCNQYVINHKDEYAWPYIFNVVNTNKDLIIESLDKLLENHIKNTGGENV